MQIKFGDYCFLVKDCSEKERLIKPLPFTLQLIFGRFRRFNQIKILLE